MAAIIHFFFVIIESLLQLLIFAIIVSAVLSWLVAFDVINLRNQLVYNVARFLDAVTRPVLRPIQRIIPPLGGVDITPIIALIVIQALINTTGPIPGLLPALEGFLLRTLGY